ncbi:proline-rich receptor-like protein kinase PERK8 [Cynara cardunculus var. scolymus]|nr:proline-rich receptor-like protein kinase PERK8 [Cynara cardunculus var. scolymus]
MATDRFIYSLAFTLLFTLSVSSDPPQISPSPAPQLGSVDLPPVPSPSPTTGSPPAPPPSSDLSPTPSFDTSSPPSLPPAPELADASDVSSANVKTEETKEASSGGMSSGKKAGIAIGVIGAVCVVGLGGMLYKKRQYNIRRAEFSSAARREFL